MRALVFTFFLLLAFTIGVEGQSEKPVWDIGTKWTYERFNPPATTSFVTNEIIDTVRINGMLLYEVESNPVYTGITYFYYKDNKVYSYNTQYEFLMLLYDFENIDSYQTLYRPICDPFFDYDQETNKEYSVLVDSIKNYTLPDGSVRGLQYLSPIDTFGDNQIPISIGTRRVLEGIGFLEGEIHHTHDFEYGVYECDELANYILKLRCFENDSVSYNFVGIPCDSTWVQTNVVETQYLRDLRIFPNPTDGIITVSEDYNNLNFELLTIDGKLSKSGVLRNSTIRIENKGVFYLRLFDDKSSIIRKIIRY